MRFVLAVVLALVALVFGAVAVPTLVAGPSAPPKADAAELQDAGPPAGARDLAVAGTVVRNGSLAGHGVGGFYYVPLVDAEAAATVGRNGYWSMPTRGPGGRLAVARLSREEVHYSGLPWDESVGAPGPVGSFCVVGEVRPPAAFDGAEELLWERLGVRADEVVLVDHGASHFGRGGASFLLGLALVCGFFVHRLVRRRAPRGDGGAAREPARPHLGGVLGGLTAAGVGMLAIGGRLVDDAARVGSRIVDDTARAFGAAADDAAAAGNGPLLSTENALEAAKTARDLSWLGDVLLPEQSSRSPVRVTLRRGTETFAREDDAAWHLVGSKATFAVERAGGIGRVQDVQFEPRRDAGEDMRMRFVLTPGGTVQARIEDVPAGGAAGGAAPTVLEVDLRFTVGTWDDLVAGKPAELVCTAGGLATLAASHAGALQEQVADAGRTATVAVAKARTPRLLRRDGALIVEAGTMSFDVTVRPR